MLAQSLCRRIAKVPSHDRLPHYDCEEGKLQCSQDDAESNAHSKGYCISCEYGGNDDSVTVASQFTADGFF